MDTDDPLIADLHEAIKGRGLTQTAAARLMGLPSQSALSNIFKGKRKINTNEAAEWRRLFGIPEGPPVRVVPVIGLASAGAWQDAIQMAGANLPVPYRIAGARAFAVEVKGTSMNKLLPEGGWAVVDPDQNRLYLNKVYLIANGDEETTIKRYCGEPARFEPVSDDPSHEPLFLEGHPYRVIGRVVSYGNTGGL